MVRENDIIELRDWLEQMHIDFINERIEPKHYEALSRMINILYGRKAKPNKYKRKSRYKRK